MCNELHKDKKWIPKTGKAWKVVRDTETLKSMCGWNNYQKLNNGWIRYYKKYSGGDGFCALPTRAEANKLVKAWYTSTYSRTKVIRIEYRDGKGEHIERSITRGIPFRTIIIGAFRPI